MNNIKVLIKIIKNYNIIYILIFGLLFTTIKSNAQTTTKPMLGAYNYQPKLNSHVNTDLLITRLKDLNANMYMWLMGGGNDWQDFQDFMPKAKMAGITVWAYLRPPTETPATGYDGPYSEPYKGDYVAWARAIADLSLRYSNLIGYIIDDFWYNTPSYESNTLFSNSYINKMVSAGKKINPKLKFYPLLYFREIDVTFLDSLSKVIDGVVAAYPGEILDNIQNDNFAITSASNILNDDYEMIVNNLPANVALNKGDYGFATVQINVTNPSNAYLNLYHYTNRAAVSSPSGYHNLQVKIDNTLVWQQDANESNGVTKIDLSSALNGKATAELKIGIYNNKNLSNYSLISELQIIDEQGISFVNSSWSEKKLGNYDLQLRKGKNSNVLPLIVMLEAEPTEYLYRYNDAATPENIAKHVQSAADFLLNNEIEGIVSYDLDMSSGNSIFNSIQQVYKNFWTNYK